MILDSRFANWKEENVTSSKQTSLFFRKLPQHALGFFLWQQSQSWMLLESHGYHVILLNFFLYHFYNSNEQKTTKIAFCNVRAIFSSIIVEWFNTDTNIPWLAMVSNKILENSHCCQVNVCLFIKFFKFNTCKYSHRQANSYRQLSSTFVTWLRWFKHKLLIWICFKSVRIL